MKVTKTALKEVFIIEPKVYKDERGFFFESFNKKNFEEFVGYAVNFVQDNHSSSSKGVLRGLHYQKDPQAQGKLVRVVSGEIYDVAIDIRKSSKTYKKWVSAILTSSNKRQLWIPEGFAHGFLSLTNNVEVLYKATNFYSKEHEGSIRWDDESININWPNIDEVLLSEKDKFAPYLN